MVAGGHVRVVLLVEYEPQDPGFNRGIWQQLEARMRDWADLHGEVFVKEDPDADTQGIDRLHDGLK